MQQPAEIEIADRLHSAAIHLLRRLRRVDDAIGLPPAELSALSVLVFGGPTSLGALAAAEQVRPPSMTRIVQSLGRKGLVTRKADAADRRAVQIRATNKGVRVLKQGRSTRVALLAQWVRTLPAQKLSLLYEACGMLETFTQSHR
jgi:DNA-binding MarR family transcriptional regulator